jgi:phospholipase/carboxylesterase
MQHLSQTAQGKVRLDMEIIETSTDASNVVIWLHGLGANGHDFVPIVPELNLPEQASIRFIFPHAPSRPVTINGGYSMRAWYDILSMDLGDDCSAEREDICASVRMINDIIEQQLEYGIAPDNILLAGFSQGGVIALYTALRFPEKLAGVMALSTYMPFVENILAEMHEERIAMPIFSAHGTDDTIVPFSSSQRYREALREKEFNLTVRDYPMQHSVCADEIRDISSWLSGRLNIN